MSNIERIARAVHAVERDRAFPSEVGDYVRPAPLRAMPLRMAEMAERQAERAERARYATWRHQEWRNLLVEELSVNPDIELSALCLIRTIIEELRWISSRRGQAKAIEEFTAGLKTSARDLATAVARSPYNKQRSIFLNDVSSLVE